MATDLNLNYLIVTADDFGYSDSRDDGIIECFKKGGVSRVSLMVNGLSASRAVEKAKEAGLPMGLHLNLTEGNPISTNCYTTLVGSDGYFLGKAGIRHAVKRGQININEVAMEIQAQIDKFEQLTGSKPLCIDGHQHVHTIPGVCEIFGEVLRNNGVRMTRLPIEDGIEQHSWKPELIKGFMLEMTQQSIEAAEVFAKYDLGSTSGYAGLKTMGSDFGSEMNTTSLQKSILEAYQYSNQNKSRKANKLSVKNQDSHSIGSVSHICELMVHPGNVTGSEGGCGNGPDSFSQSADRENEMNILNSKEMKDFYEKQKIKIIAFEDCEVVKSCANSC